VRCELEFVLALELVVDTGTVTVELLLHPRNEDPTKNQAGGK
jgi:hypothetical protein